MIKQATPSERSAFFNKFGNEDGDLVLGKFLADLVDSISHPSKWSDFVAFAIIRGDDQGMFFNHDISNEYALDCFKRGVERIFIESCYKKSARDYYESASALRAVG